MDAKLRNAAVCLTLCLLPQIAWGATKRSTNFIVTAPTDEIAEKVARCAEVWREDLALQWLGEKLPNWYKPCPISVKVGQIGAGGSTTFTFDNGEVFGWNMKVQGTLERILDSVIPHEVNHTIFASHFRRPLPRWADEGAATLFEHRSEQARQIDTLNRVFKTSRRIPLQSLLTIKEYPEDMQDVLTLYAEGYSLATFLVGQKGDQGRTVYLKFLEDAHRMNWSQAIRQHYGFTSVEALEQKWTTWVLAGSPSFTLPEAQQLAANSDSEDRMIAANVPADGGAESVIRFQSPKGDEPLAMIPRALRDRNEITAANVTPANASQNTSLRRSAELSTERDLSEMNENPARGDAGDSRLRSGMERLAAPQKSRDSLNPTADGIFSNTNAANYAFPKMRSF